MVDHGIDTVRYVYEIMMIDPEWSVWDGRGFTWWGEGLAQQVWAEPSFTDRGISLWRLNARTDIVRGLQDSTERRHRLAALAAFSTMSGWILNPDDPSRLQSASSVFVHEQNWAWLERLFALVVAVQATEAHIEAPLLSEILGGEPDCTGHPLSGMRNEPDDMLNVIDQLVRLHGGFPCTWTGAEMEVLARMLEGGSSVLADSGPTGATAEFPFGPDTSLLEVRPECHKRLGNGVLLTLKLPVPDSGECGTGPDFLEMNRRELGAVNGAPLIGSWCRSPEGLLAHVCFLPNLSVRPGLLSVLAMGFANRAEWVDTAFFARATVIAPCSRNVS